MLKKLSLVLSLLLFSANIPTQALPIDTAINSFDYGYYQIPVQPLWQNLPFIAQCTKTDFIGAGVIASFAVLSFTVYGLKTAICKYILKKKHAC